MRGVLGWKALSLALVAGLVFAAADAKMAQSQVLRGESQLLFEVARQELIDERATALRDEVGARLRGARIAYTELAVESGALKVRVSGAADIGKAKEVLANLLEPTRVADATEPVSELSLAEPEPGLLRYTLTGAGIDRRIGLAVDQSLKIMERRVLAIGIDHPVVEKQGPDRIKVTAGGLHDPGQLRETLVRRARLTLQWIDESVPVGEALNGNVPAGSSILKATGDPSLQYLVKDDVVLSGDNIVDAAAGVDQYSGAPVISFRFDDEGTRLFAEATGENVGHALAIILDGEVMMAPIIREPILGGAGQISGNFTTQSAGDLALLLRAGALPAKLDLIEARFKPVDQ